MGPELLARLLDLNETQSGVLRIAFRVADEKGLSDEQAIAIFEKVNQIGFDVIEGKYTRESYEMAYNAMNYAADVETARKEGEVAGKNQKIEEKLAKVEKPIDMPPTVGGQGASVPETAPKKKRNNMFGL